MAHSIEIMAINYYDSPEVSRKLFWRISAEGLQKQVGLSTLRDRLEKPSVSEAGDEVYLSSTSTLDNDFKC